MQLQYSCRNRRKKVCGTGLQEIQHYGNSEKAVQQGRHPRNPRAKVSEFRISALILSIGHVTTIKCCFSNFIVVIIEY